MQMDVNTHALEICGELRL